MLQVEPPCCDQQPVLSRLAPARWRCVAEEPVVAFLAAAPVAVRAVARGMASAHGTSAP